MGGAGHEAPWVAPPGISWRATGSRSVPLIAVESWPDHKHRGRRGSRSGPFGGAGPPNFGVGFSIAPLAEYGGLSGAADPAGDPARPRGPPGGLRACAGARRRRRRAAANCSALPCGKTQLRVACAWAPCCSSSSSLSSVAGRPWMSVMVSSSTIEPAQFVPVALGVGRVLLDAVVDPGAWVVGSIGRGRAGTPRARWPGGTCQASGTSAWAPITEPGADDRAVQDDRARADRQRSSTVQPQGGRCARRRSRLPIRVGRCPRGVHDRCRPGSRSGHRRRCARSRPAGRQPARPTIRPDAGRSPMTTASGMDVGGPGGSGARRSSSA